MTIREPAPGDGETQSDLLALVRRARDGDRETADRLYAEVRPRLLRIALALGADPDAAADTVQDSLWAAHRNLRRFDPSRASFLGWLGVIVVRRLRNRRRAAARRRRLLDALSFVPRGGGDPGQRIAEARLTLQGLLQRLTDRQREVVALYEIGELGAEEVARTLGLTPAGVRSIARDARNRLSAAARAGDDAGEERR